MKIIIERITQAPLLTTIIMALYLLQLNAVMGQSCDLDCGNGGRCEIAPPDFQNPNGFAYCLCPSGWIGDLCEEAGPDVGLDTPSCDMNCQNGGQCEFAPPDVQNPNGFQYCICPSTWRGDLCDEGGPNENQNTPLCDLSCLNGGRCEFSQRNPQNPTGDPYCICPPGYVGDACEFGQNNQCDLNCQNGGQCQMVPPDEQNINGFKYCLCPPGLLGDLCERGEPEPVCNLQCQNGGTCEVGMAGSDDTDGFQYCLCRAGTHGTLCEEEQEKPCGDHYCYHGGKCVVGGDGAKYCDCTTTNDPTKHYTGKYCQYEATSYCSQSNEYFCVNGGTCVSQGDSGTFSCNCPDGWSGPSCEFESQNREHHYENCTLTCYNGGECRKGAKDMSAILGLGPELSHLAEETAHSENFEHCVCADGFTGLKCEHEYEECGDGEHICLHGSKCVPPQNELHPVWTCECEEAFREDHLYAGKFCQHHHTSTCTTDDAQNDVYLGYKSLAFCVNDGVCTEIVENGERRPGCTCPPGYVGAHCELLDTDIHHDGPPLKTKKEMSAALIFFFLVLSILIIVLGGIVVLRIRRGEEWRIESAHFGDDPGKSPIMEQVDFHGDGDGLLEDVELI